MKSVLVDIPPLTEQKKIANVLSALDDKIENNRRTNRTLEEICQALYKRWFDDFDFPNEDGEPYKSSGGKMVDSELGEIPAGWSIGKFGDHTEIKRGGSPRPINDYLSDSGLNWLKISDVTSVQTPYINVIKDHILESGLHKTVFLKSGSLVLSNSATPGIPKILDVDSCIHDGWLYFPKSIFSNCFLYLYFQEIKSKLVKLGNGSVFTNLKTDILRYYPMIMPDKKTLMMFDNTVNPIFIMIRNTTRETHKLSQLRDTLLPRLMSGEIEL